MLKTKKMSIIIIMGPNYRPQREEIKTPVGTAGADAAGGGGGLG